MTQLMKIDADGKKFSIVYNPGKVNPYYIYRHTWGVAKCGYGYTEKKRVEAKYVDIASCLYYLATIY